MYVFCSFLSEINKHNSLYDDVSRVGACLTGCAAIAILPRLVGSRPDAVWQQ